VSLIQIKGLTKYYRMGDSIVHALDGVDLEIERGEFIAVTGASGSGKSTIMHLLGCLDRPTAGEYHLNGRNVSQMSDRELAAVRNQDIGFVFQTFNLINRTSALDNVGVPLFYARTTNTRAPARRALERVGLTGRITHTPSELSGGERQRVAIARAIVNDPVIVFADEPTGNLDTRTGEQIMEVFRSLNEQGVTIVLVTHESDVAMQTKRIVHMSDGKITMDKPASEIEASVLGVSNLSQNIKSTHKPVATPIVSVITDAAPVATQAVPEAVAVAKPATVSEPKAISEEQMTARFASGANAVLASGILTPVLLAGGMIGGVLLKNIFGDQKFSPENPPPPEVAVYGLLLTLSLLLSIISGFVSVFWGRAVRRRIRSVPGRWIGGKRVLTGMICGGGTLALLGAMIAINIVAWMMKAKTG